MGDSENLQQPSKKRGALKQLSRDNPGLDDDEDSTELESGTFKKASDEVLASRKIVKVKRKEPSATPPNPFAGILLVPPPATAVGTETKLTPAEAVAEDKEKVIHTGETDKVDVKEETEKAKTEDSGGDQAEIKVKEDDESKESSATPPNPFLLVPAPATALTETKLTPAEAVVEGNEVDVKEETKSEEQAEIKVKEDDDESKEEDKNGVLSSFQQHSSSKNAFTGLATTEASPSSFLFGSVSTGSGASSSIFGESGASSKPETSLFPQVSTETGEENEKVVFSADSVMFEYIDGGWKERGNGGLKVNVDSNGGKARLVMRAKGNYRLILNASLYPEMKLTKMEKKGITFACVNSVSEVKGLSTFAVKFKDPIIVEEFREAIEKHKNSKEKGLPVKAPENSPTALCLVC